MKMPLSHIAHLLLATTCLLALASCANVKPDGVVDNVVSGNLFGGESDDPPPNVNHVPPPPPPGGPVRWRMNF